MRHQNTPNNKRRGAKPHLPTGEVFTQNISDDIHDYTPWGLLAGDELTCEDSTDVHPGELISYETSDRKDAHISRLVSLTANELTVREVSGFVHTYDLHEVAYVARIVSLTRALTHRRTDPAPAASPTGSPGQVVDLTCYRQAHPRRITRAIFGEQA